MNTSYYRSVRPNNCLEPLNEKINKIKTLKSLNETPRIINFQCDKFSSHKI